MSLKGNSMRKMMLFSSLAGIISTSAFAYKFECSNEDATLVAKVFESSRPDRAVMVFANPNYKPGRQTIAVFENAIEELNTTSFRIRAIVDPNDARIRPGEYIGGTRVKYVEEVAIIVDEHSREDSTALLDLKLTNGKTRQVDLTCKDLK